MPDAMQAIAEFLPAVSWSAAGRVAASVLSVLGAGGATRQACEGRTARRAAEASAEAAFRQARAVEEQVEIQERRAPRASDGRTHGLTRFHREIIQLTDEATFENMSHNDAQRTPEVGDCIDAPDAVARTVQDDGFPGDDFRQEYGPHIEKSWSIL